MSFKMRRDISPLWLVVISMFSAASANAASGVWNGTVDGYWTNRQNWGASPYPSSGQTATFANGGNSRTVIDVAGLPSIKNVTFTSANVAAYTIGAGGSCAQTLVVDAESAITLDASAANSQVVNANIQLGTDQNTTVNSFRNDSTTRTLTLAGNLLSPTTGGTPGYKNIYVNGAGETRFLGNLIKNYVVIIYANGSGILTLSGSNQISRLQCTGSSPGRVDIGDGYLYLDNVSWYPLMAYQDTVIDGTGTFRITPNAAEGLAWCHVQSGKTLTINASIRCVGGLNFFGSDGTLVLNGLNVFASNIVFNCAGIISVTKIGNRGSTGNNLGQGNRVVFNTSGGKLLYTGTGETTDRILEINSDAALDHSGAGELIFSADLVVGGNVKTLTLQGSGTGIGEIAGAIGPGSAATSLAKNGSGTWSLSGANTYVGATTVSNGMLVLTGTAGSAALSSGFAVQQGGTLQLVNAAGANRSDRLGDTAPVALNGGTLSFSHAGGAADYSETVGALVIGFGKNTIAVSQADDARTSSLTFASLAHTSGTVDFTGDGLGESDRCRIYIAGQADGLIGAWATVNGTNLAAYSSALGVYATGESVYTDIAARGPDSIIPDSAAAAVRINLPGESGPITLDGGWSNRVGLLLQNTGTDAVVAMCDGTTNKTLLTEGLLIAADKAALTIGQSAGDGLLMALNEGGALVLANDATNATLTVNAVVTNHVAASSLSKRGPGNVMIAGAARYTGTTAINGGTLTFGSASDQTLPGPVVGAGAWAKTGAGVLRLGGNNTYAGATLINAGTVIADHSNALGPNGAGTVVASNATLDVGGSLAENTLKLGAETVTISGAGVDGKGAIINSSTSKEQRFALYGSKVSLAGDAAIGGNQRFGFWPDSLSPLLDLNNFTLSKLGSNVFSIIHVDVNPGGGHIDVKEGVVWLVYSTRLNGGATNNLTVRDNAQLRFYELWNPQPWTLALNNRSHLGVTSGAIPSNTWNGPVTLSGTAILDGNNSAAMSLKINGPVSGSGSLVKTDPMTAYLTHTNNTYTGTTIVSNGVLSVAYVGSLPRYGIAGQVTVAPGGTLAAMTGDGTVGWSKAQLDTLRTTATFVSSSAALGLDTTFGDFVYGDHFTQAFSLAKYGTNTLTLAGANAISNQMRVCNGTLTLANTSTNAIASVLVTGSQGSVLNLNGPLTLVNYGSLTNGSASGDRCVMRITTNLTIMADKNSSTLGKLFVGCGTGSAGAVYQTAGRVSVSSGLMWTDFVSIGNAGGYGYYRMTGGTLVAGELGVTGGTGGNNVGVFDFYGGTVNVNGAHLLVGWSQGVGVLNLYGGSVSVSTGWLYITYGANAGTFGMLNLLGPTASLAMNSASYNLQMANANGNQASVINLNSGTLTVYQVLSTQSGTPSYFNFNGGTLRAVAAQTAFLQGLTTATVYPGGAVFDTAGFNITVNQTLCAPVGYGVTGLTLASGGAGYIGAPAVKISGGSGTNATAIAEVDLTDGSPTQGQVTGIRVISPGFGYQATNVLAATLYGGGYQTAATVGSAITLGGNTSGGLTKLGTGTLTLGGTNTYAGATVISNGTLRLGNAQAVLKGTTIVLAGGTLDLNGFTVTNVLSGTSGTVSNGTMQATISPAGAGTVGSDTFVPGTATVKGVYLADVTADGANDFLTVQGSFNLSNLSLTLVNPALLNREKTYTLAKVTGTRTGMFTTTNLPDSRWHVLYLADGKVELVFCDGMLFMLH